jgi:aminopeptidase N
LSTNGRRLAVGIVVVAAALALPALAAAAPRFAHGSPGVGDPYFPRAGNGGYDVSHYVLALRYAPSRNRLKAVATIEAEATERLSRFDLDLRGMRVRSVRVDGQRAEVHRRGQELRVGPRHPLREGQAFKVRVRYRGRPHPVIDPDGAADGWMPTDDGAFVAGEPQGAPTWFPCNDHPSDKATYDFRVTVPRGRAAIANGRLVRLTRRGRHKVFVWSEDAPMATYLATVTIGRFRISRSTVGAVRSLVAVDPRESGAARRVLKKLPAMLNLYSRRFGDYPFGQTGAIVDRAPSVGYALETQTRPLFDTAPDQATLAHELSHQWFGDAVTPARWRDIWLNEGFATWAEWYWDQHVGGPRTEARFDSLYATDRDDTRFWNPPPADPGGPENLFDGTIYDRGGMALEALRQRVGNATFFRILGDWVSGHRYGNGTTKQFIQLVEEQGGAEAGGFLRPWLYRPARLGKPPHP